MSWFAVAEGEVRRDTVAVGWQLKVSDQCYSGSRKKGNDCVTSVYVFFSLFISYTAQKMKFSAGIWSHLLNKSSMENFIFCEVLRLSVGSFRIVGGIRCCTCII